MKILKGLLSWILGLLLTTFILALSLSFLLKNIVQDEIIGNVVKEKVKTEYIDKSELENKEEIKEILDDEDVKKIIDYAIADYVNYLDTGKGVSKKTTDAVIDFIIKHKEKIETSGKTTINESELRSQKTYDDISKTSIDIFKQLDDQMDGTAKTIVEIYGKSVSNTTRMILLAAIVLITLLLLFLLHRKTFKWLSKLGSSLLSCGTLFVALYVVGNTLLDKLIKDNNLDFTLNTSSLLIVGIVELSVGVVLIITKIIISIVRKKSNNESKPQITNEPQYSVHDIKPATQPVQSQTNNVQPNVQNVVQPSVQNTVNQAATPSVPQTSNIASTQSQNESSKEQNNTKSLS